MKRGPIHSHESVDDGQSRASLPVRAGLTSALQRSSRPWQQGLPPWLEACAHPGAVLPDEPALEGIPLPRIPEGIPEQDGNSPGVMTAMLVSYYRTVPPHLRDEYVRLVMKAAGELAGRMVRHGLEGK